MRRGDWLVLGLMMCLVAASAWLMWAQREGDPARVLVRVQGKVVQVLPLNQDRHVTVEGLLGDSELEIHDGKVRFTDSPCTNRQCILRGWLHRSGDMAACLPNRVSVSIVGQDAWFDAVNF